ncbi:hypothetical protein LRAMOSA02740 [Lichtheimia ramosa]|uniref:Putative 5'-nucleotidase C-terminal domain-containing protein n=1 Tax=Lichtheimia ramosa TaxID=688394 RepID=A0A077WSL8_9FUNG|nr:hypothetical protein LRAMOSA02740 [Lichtheimia ramosa]
MRIGSSSLLTLGALSLVVNAHPLTRRQQPEAVNTPQLDLEPLAWGDVNFIQTTDTHGWLAGHVLEPSYNGDLGDFYSFVIRMKELAKKKKKDLFVVDCGDTHDGAGLSDVTFPHGLLSQPMLMNIPYDVLAIGNHELYVNEVTEDVYKNFMPHWKGRYLASNVYFKDVNNNKTVPIGNKYTYFEGEFGTKVLAFGFLFDFTGNGNNSVVHKVEDEVKEPWFGEALKSHKPDIIALMGHTGVRFEEFKVALKAIREYYPYLPVAVLGGHVHVRDFAIYDGWAAGIASGRYLETVGFFSLDGVKETNKFIKKHGHHHSQDVPKNLTFHRRYLDQNRHTYLFHSETNEHHFDTELGEKISRNITEWRKNYNVSNRLGCSPQNYYLSAAKLHDNSSIFELMATEVFPKTVADPSRPNPAYVIMNSGGIRYDIYKGPFLEDNVYNVCPFADDWLYVADVPYDAAAKLLDSMNGDSAASNYKRKRDLGGLERSLHPLKSYPSEEFQTFLQRREDDDDNANVTMIPGYTTVDDMGDDGDDTKHIKVPYYEAPTFVASYLPENKTEVVDVVFISFVQEILLDTLYKATGKNYTVENYGNPNITSSTMWNKFAQDHWASNC